MKEGRLADKATCGLMPDRLSTVGVTGAAEHHHQLCERRCFLDAF